MDDNITNGLLYMRFSEKIVEDIMDFHDQLYLQLQNRYNKDIVFSKNEELINIENDIIKQLFVKLFNKEPKFIGSKEESKLSEKYPIAFDLIKTGIQLEIEEICRGVDIEELKNKIINSSTNILRN